jgi:hypothetical protein
MTLELVKSCFIAFLKFLSPEEISLFNIKPSELVCTCKVPAYTNALFVMKPEGLGGVGGFSLKNNITNRHTTVPIIAWHNSEL